LDVNLQSDSPVLDLLGHGQESLLDVGSVLGRGLEERNSELVGEFLRSRWRLAPTLSTQTNPLPGALCTHLCHGVFYNLLVRQIALVSDKQLVDSLDGVTVDLLQPLLDVGEGV
jgi:hypothetical protein